MRFAMRHPDGVFSGDVLMCFGRCFDVFWGDTSEILVEHVELKQLEVERIDVEDVIVSDDRSKIRSPNRIMSVRESTHDSCAAWDRFFLRKRLAGCVRMLIP